MKLLARSNVVHDAVYQPRGDLVGTGDDHVLVTTQCALYTGEEPWRNTVELLQQLLKPALDTRLLPNALIAPRPQQPTLKSPDTSDNTALHMATMTLIVGLSSPACALANFTRPRMPSNVAGLATTKHRREAPAAST